MMHACPHFACFLFGVHGVGRYLFSFLWNGKGKDSGEEHSLFSSHWSFSNDEHDDEKKEG